MYEIEDMNFNRNDRVITPHGPGTVAYRRMEAPDYTKAVSYSVILDHKKDLPGYTGSTYSADQVTKEK